MSAAGGRGPRLLPPLARGRDWLAAGLGAGLCLGAAESLGLHVEGIELSWVQALALVATDAALVAALSAPLALGTGLARLRLCHSTLSGGVLGPLLLAPAVARASVRLQNGVAEDVPAVLLLGAGVAALGGVMAGWVGGRLERAGIPISGPPVWSAVALLVAAAGAVRAGSPVAPSPALLLGLLAAVVVLALVAALLAVVGARRESLVPWPWGRTLLALATAAVGIALAPRLLPWLLLDPPSARSLARAPDVVVVDLGVFAPGEGPDVRGPTAGVAGSPAPNLALLAATGVLYRKVLAPPDQDAGFDWLRVPDGLPVARVLRAQGYVTRAAGAGKAGAAPPAGFDRVDAGGSADEREAALRATTGGAVLAAIGADTAGSLAHGSTAAGVSGEARRRIAASHALAPERPLLLLVDYSAVTRGPTLALDDEVGAMLDFLGGLGLEETARIVVTWSEDGTSAGAPGEPSGGRVLQVLLRPEPSAPQAVRGEVVESFVLASEVAERVAGLPPAPRDLP